MRVQGWDRDAADGDSGRRKPLGYGSSRLLCDDGVYASCRDGVGKSQGSRGIDGWTATGLNAASRMRQGDNPSTRRKSGGTSSGKC